MTGHYPLDWPLGWPRTPDPQPAGSRFGQGLSIERARRGLYQELERLGAEDVRLSSNLQLRIDGMPKSGQRAPDDPGVAVYFTRDGADLVIACDLYNRCEHNLRALALVIESMRRIERYGGDKMMERTFTGFTALPPPSTGPQKRPWHEVLNVLPDAPIEVAEAAYRHLAKQRHPDAPGGSDEAMAELNQGIKEARER